MESTGGQAAQERCRARTEEGDRCSRPAGDDGFCYQHDADDPTVTADEGSTGGEDGSQAEAERDGPETPTADGGSATEPAAGSSADGDVPDILAVRRAVQDAAEGVIGRPLDGVLEVSPDDEGGWRVEVEVVERAAVPDTQDILGRYEVEVDDDARVRGYRRLERYRRGDTSPSQPQ